MIYRFKPDAALTNEQLTELFTALQFQIDDALYNHLSADLQASFKPLIAEPKPSEIIINP